MAGPPAGLEASGGPEPLALVLLSRPHVPQRTPGPADRVPPGRVACLQPRVWCGQDVTGRGGRGRPAAHRVALVPPGVPRAVEDAYVLVAVELHQPKSRGRARNRRTPPRSGVRCRTWLAG